MPEIEKDAQKEKSIGNEQMGCTVEGLRLLARIIARCHRAKCPPGHIKAIPDSADSSPSGDVEHMMQDNDEMLAG